MSAAVYSSFGLAPEFLGDSTAYGRDDESSSDPLWLRLIVDSYLSVGSFTQFAVEVMQMITYAISVPVAFTEGFLRSYLSIERMVEHDDGRITLIPKHDAAVEDMTRDVDEITARIDPGAVFNPVVRVGLSAAHQTAGHTMKWDLDELAGMSDDQLMDVLREMRNEEVLREMRVKEQAASENLTSDYIHHRMEMIRRNVHRFQEQYGGKSAVDPQERYESDAEIDSALDSLMTD